MINRVLTIVKRYFKLDNRQILWDRIYILTAILWLPVMLIVYACWSRYLKTMIICQLLWLYMYRPGTLLEIIHWLDQHFPAR